MPTSDVVTQTLDVPGARLYYERRGSGPLLLVIGSPMDSTGFAALAASLAGRYTVVTYDPRGIGHSSREDTTADVTPEQQADDVHRLLSAIGGQPAHVFGSSGGAAVGLALVTAHPGQARTLVAHEPPVIDLLTDREQVRAQMQDIYSTYLSDGVQPAMQKFMACAGLGGAPGTQAAGPPQEPPGTQAAEPPQEPPGTQAAEPRQEPPAGQAAQMRANTEMFLAHMIRQTTDFRPDIKALRAAPARIVVAAGATSTGQLANRTAVALAGRLGTPVVEFPGDHGGFIFMAGQFGSILDQVLTGKEHGTVTLPERALRRQIGHTSASRSTARPM
jgi:pimeloyl-ACP methyl ester carboxylesterase